MQINTKFSCGDKVKVVPDNVIGKVDSIAVTIDKFGSTIEYAISGGVSPLSYYDECSLRLIEAANDAPIKRRSHKKKVQEVQKP